MPHALKRNSAIPAPRPTKWAAIYVLLYLGIPAVGILALLDLVLFLVFRYGFGRCYGIGCWM
jgi:hypothetical protein